MLEYCAGTTVGSRRTVNEDAFGVFEDTNAFVVVDGCGGVSSGESAARLTIECFRKVLREQGTGIDGLIAADPLAVAVLRANAEVFREAHTNPASKGQGATLCAARAFERWVTIAHVGDCRIGCHGGSCFAWLTEDHLVVAEMRRSGAPTEQLAEMERKHPTVLSRAVGGAERVSADVSYHPTSPGDIYLLCSDGLSRYVEQSRIAEVLRECSSSPRACCSALLEAAEKAGGHDNATVIVLRLRV